jgi:hypothetical protein
MVAIGFLFTQMTLPERIRQWPQRSRTAMAAA